LAENLIMGWQTKAFKTVGMDISIFGSKNRFGPPVKVWGLEGMVHRYLENVHPNGVGGQILIPGRIRGGKISG